MSQRPNFLFIITDQHRADHLGCYGNKTVRTPHIDALASQGLRGERFYVANPVCSPNRASIVTGRMPSQHRVRHNGIELDLTETTFIDRLREAGYRTALVGKAHLQCIHDSPAHYPKPEERLPREARRPDGGPHGQELETIWEEDPKHDLVYPYYGFERADLSIMHGDAQLGHWRRWIRTQTEDADRLIGPQNAIPAPELELAKLKQAWRTRVPEELYPTSWITDRTIGAMRESQREGKPFFIQCSYPDPHHPYTPPGKYWSMYSPDDVELPASYKAQHRNTPPHLLNARATRDAGKAVKTGQAPFACTEREAREAIALNYCAISMIDDGVGRLLAELDAAGLARNTVVIFTSDHGDFMGDHQMLLKGPMHYQGLIRVPFIWRDPQGRAGRTTSALLQSIDIAPSVLERAGVPAFNGIQGKSMLPVISGAKDALRDAVLVEDDRQRLYFGFQTRVRLRSLVTPTHRLSLYDETDWGELYDHTSDPDELVNLWGDPGKGAIRAELTERLARALLETAETSPYPTFIA